MPDPKAALGGHKQSEIGAEWRSQALKPCYNVLSMHIYRKIDILGTRGDGPSMQTFKDIICNAGARVTQKSYFSKAYWQVPPNNLE